MWAAACEPAVPKAETFATLRDNTLTYLVRSSTLASGRKEPALARPSIKPVLLGAVAFAAAGALLPVAELEAQDAARSWRVAVWVKGGYQHSNGNFAQSQPSDLEQLQNYLSQFRVEPVQLVGAGIEVRFPEQSMGARLGWERSGVTDAIGRLGICNVLEGPICEPEVATAQFQSLMAEFRFLMRQQRDRIRPLLLVGAGFREMAFDSPACDPNAEDPLICRTIVALYDNPVPHGYLRLGLGMEASPGPLVLNVVGSVGTGRYGSGVDHVHGQWYNEMRIEASAGYVVY